MRIGFIGLGNMGWPMAARLREAGNELVVYDVRSEQARAFAEANGARIASSPADLAGCAETVLMSLPTPAALLEVVRRFEDPGSDRRARVVVDLSTAGPRAAIEAAGTLGKYGMRFVDAPVSGGVSGAASGTLAIMASGRQSDYESVLPLLRTLGRPFLVGGAAGQGQAMKLLNNLLSANAMAATTEVMVLGVKAGLDPRTMLDVFNASSGRNTATTDKFPRSVMDRSFNFGFRAVLLHKDVRLCKEFADEHGVPFTIGNAVESVWRHAADRLGDADFTRIVEIVEEQTGVIVGARDARAADDAAGDDSAGPATQS